MSRSRKSEGPESNNLRSNAEMDEMRKQARESLQRYAEKFSKGSKVKII